MISPGHRSYPIASWRCSVEVLTQKRTNTVTKMGNKDIYIANGFDRVCSDSLHNHTCYFGNGPYYFEMQK